VTTRRKLISPNTSATTPNNYDPPLTMDEIIRTLMATGSVSETAQLLGRTPQGIYHRLQSKEGQQAIRHSRSLIVDKAWRKLIKALDSEDESIYLQAIEKVMKYGGIYGGFAQHQTLEAVRSTGGVLQVPMPITDEKEWERQAQNYFHQRDRLIESQGGDPEEEPEDEEPEDEYLRELNFENENSE